MYGKPRMVDLFTVKRLWVGWWVGCLVGWLVGWYLTALSAQKGYIVP